MNTNTSTQIGDLLVGAGLVTQTNIDGALSMSRSRKQPLGKVLADSGLVTDDELFGALQAQNLIRERLLSLEAALAVLRLQRERGGSFIACLEERGCQIESINFGLTLGRLFIEAGTLTAQQLSEALETSILSGLPLVRVLVLQKAMGEKTAYAGLTAQLLLREKRIGRDQAVGALKLAHMHGSPIEEIIEFGGFKKIRDQNFVRLGEILVLAELISEIDLLSCVEKSMSEAKPIGQILVDDGIMDEQLVGSALRAQKYIEDGTIDALRASQLLSESAKSGRPLEFSVEELASIRPVPISNTSRPSLVELLGALGLIPLSALEQVELVEKQEPSMVESFLLERRILTGGTLDAVKQGHALIESGQISTEQLIFAIHVWLWTRGDFKDTLTLLGWQACRS